MGDSKPCDPQFEDLLTTIKQSIASCGITKDTTVCIALSGGLDSVALLDLLVYFQPNHQYRLSACYVHHGISQFADDWLMFCQNLCQDKNIPFRSSQVPKLDKYKIGFEKAARDARYKILFEQPENVIALAHHQNDQAETLLLQLFRGTGLAGLAAMDDFSPFPAHPDSPKRLWRPLLTLSKKTIGQLGNIQTT